MEQITLGEPVRSTACALVGTLCRVPVPREILGSRQWEEEGSQLFARAGEVPVHRGLGTSASSEPSAAMSQHGDDRGSNCCRLSGKVWLGFFCLVLPFSFFHGEGTEQGEPCWSLVTSVTGCIQRSLLTAWANNADVAQAVFSLSDS